MSKYEPYTQTVIELHNETGADKDDIYRTVADLHEKYKVPLAEAKKSTRRTYTEADYSSTTADDTDGYMPTEPQRLEETMQETETTHNLNESADKIRLKTQLKRGSGTRDQDTIEVKIRGDDPTEAVEKLNRTLELLNETAEIARGTQADE